MPQVYQALYMVVQLGDDPRALEQQQQQQLALDHMKAYQQQFAQQQQP